MMMLKNIQVIALLSLAIATTTANKLPTFTRGAYMLLADDTISVKNDAGERVPSHSGVWQPRFGQWVHQFNVLFFAFIGAEMKVPPSFDNARASGQFAADTKIIYSIAGGSYSRRVSDWMKWFDTPDNAKRLAAQVATWKSDGIDIDFEEGIGNDHTISQNLVVFVQEVRRLRPDFIITQAAFGYPQIYGESLLTVKSWNAQGQNTGLLNSLGLMVYSAHDSLQYVNQYRCTASWCALCDNAEVSSPCSVVPRNQLIAGLDGGSSQGDVDAVCSGNVGGYMIWYASADNGFSYGGNGDGRKNPVNWKCNQASHHHHHEHKN